MKAGACKGALALVLGALILLSRAAAAPGLASGRGTNYALARWTTDHGLPQNSVRCLLQSRDGHLWVGTEDGLARYDGSRFTIFDKANTPALRSAQILCLAEDGLDILWIGTQDGLVARRDGRFIRHVIGTNAAQNRIRSLCAARDGRLWIGTGSGVTTMSPGDPTPAPPALPPPPDPAGRTYYSMEEDSTGCLWSFTTVGVLRKPPASNAWSRILPAPIFPMPNILAPLCQDRSSAMWLGYQDGLWRWRDDEVTCFTQTNGLPAGIVTALAEDLRGNLWIGTHEGRLIRFADGKFADLSSLVEPRGGIHCLLADREGSLWIGTHRSGLVRLQPPRLTTIATPDARVWSVAQSPAGELWLGMTYWVSRLEQSTFTNFYRSGYNVVQPDRSGRLWVASNEGLFRMEDGLLAPQALPGSTNLTTLFLDRRGALWVAGEHALHRYTDGAWRHFDVPVASRAKQLSGIVEDHAGALWVGSAGGGVFKLQDGSFASLTGSNGLTSDVAAPLLAEPDGTLWIGSDRGLNRCQNDRITRYTTADGLPENHVLNLIDDGEGWFWTLGYRGIHRLRKQELTDFAAGRCRTIRSVDYGTADGMRHPQGNIGRYPNTCRTRDGRLWFPTVEGLVIADPRTLDTNPPAVFIEQVTADGELVFNEGAALPQSLGISNSKTKTQNPELRLAPGRGRVVQFRFTAPALSGADKVRFRYRLEGQDRAWTELEPGRERVAAYASLRPARYHFEVHAANRDGYWSSLPATLAFSIAPYFRQTWMFYAACALGVLGFAAGLQTYRLRVQQRILGLEQQAALDLERARIARDLHDQLGSGLTRINILSELAARGGAAPHLEKIAASARELLAGVGEMVWAASPRHDSLPALADYFGRTAQDFLQPAGLAVRLDVPVDLPPTPISGEVRLHLFLAFKEALANILKHAQAGEVHVRIRVENPTLRLTVGDNGRGFEISNLTSQIPNGGGNGLLNLRQRLESIGGRCEVESRPGHGTMVRFTVPLPALE